MVYHSPEDLHALGERVLDAALKGPTLEESLLGRDVPLPVADDFHARWDGIPDLFASFGGPDPSACDSGVAALRKAAYVIRPVMPGGSKEEDDYQPPENFYWDEDPVDEWLAEIGEIRDHWLGSAGDAFATYLGQFKTMTDRQHGLAVTLAATLRAHQAILSCCYHDVWNIGTETIKALDTVYDWDPQTGSVDLAIGAALAAMLAEIATDGSAGPFLTAGSEALGVGSAVVGSMPSNVSISGGSVDGILSSTSAALKKVAGVAEHHRSDLVTMLSAAVAWAESTLHSHELVPDRPDDLLDLKSAKKSTVTGIDGFYLGGS